MSLSKRHHLGKVIYVEITHLLINFNKTNFFPRNTKNDHRIGIHKQNTHTQTKHSEKKNIEKGVVLVNACIDISVLALCLVEPLAFVCVLLPMKLSFRVTGRNFIMVLCVNSSKENHKEVLSKYFLQPKM